jgi:hypothetical protein
MYHIGGSVLVMVTLVEGSYLVIKLTIGMCVYLRFKFAGRLIVYVCMWSELVTEVCAEEQTGRPFHVQFRNTSMIINTRTSLNLPNTYQTISTPLAPQKTSRG